MDKVFIDELLVETVIGLYPWEKEVKQPLTISLELGWDIRRAAATDDLSTTLNYAEIAEHIQAYAQDHKHILLESFAEDLAARLIRDFSIPWLCLRVAKTTTVPAARQVGIQIERSAEDYPSAGILR